MFDAKATNTAPLIIGLDRTTLKHSLNVLATFDTPPNVDTETSGKSRLRPLYTNNTDIIGVQSKGNDISATESNYLSLTEESILPVWCTMCS